MINHQENYYNPENEKVGAWTLIQNYAFERALIEADAEFEITNSPLPLRNKLYAYFHLKRYRESIELSKKIIEISKDDTDSDFIFLGIAQWLLDDKQKAIESWKLGERSKYSDAAGGIELQLFLFFAAVSAHDQKLKDKVTKKITKLVKRDKSNSYPVSLGAYLLGEINNADLLDSVENIDQFKERQLCQIAFVFAIKELELGNFELYYANLKLSISYGAKSFLEQTYYLAVGELDKA